MVAAHPGDEITVADRLAQPSGHRDEQFVAYRVAEAVIDVFEGVEVEVDQRVAATGPGKLCVEELHEVAAGVKTGQTIETGLTDQRRLGALAGGEILGDAEHRAHRAVTIA